MDACLELGCVKAAGPTAELVPSPRRAPAPPPTRPPARPSSASPCASPRPGGREAAPMATPVSGRLLTVEASCGRPVQGQVLRQGGLLRLDGADRIMKPWTVLLFSNGFYAVPRQGRETDPSQSFAWSPFTSLYEVADLPPETVARVGSETNSELAPFGLQCVDQNITCIFATCGANARRERQQWVAAIGAALRVFTVAAFPPFEVAAWPLSHKRNTETRLLAGYLIRNEPGGVVFVPYCELHAHNGRSALFAMYTHEDCAALDTSLDVTTATPIVDQKHSMCFRLGPFELCARALQEKRLWLRALQNIKVKIANGAPAPDSHKLRHWREAVLECAARAPSPPAPAAAAAGRGRGQAQGVRRMPGTPFGADRRGGAERGGPERASAAGAQRRAASDQASSHATRRREGDETSPRSASAQVLPRRGTPSVQSQSGNDGGTRSGASPRESQGRAMQAKELAFTGGLVREDKETQRRSSSSSARLLKSSTGVPEVLDDPEDANDGSAMAPVRRAPTARERSPLKDPEDLDESTIIAPVGPVPATLPMPGLPIQQPVASAAAPHGGGDGGRASCGRRVGPSTTALPGSRRCVQAQVSSDPELGRVLGFDRFVLGAASASHAASTSGGDPVSPRTLDGLDAAFLQRQLATLEAEAAAAAAAVAAAQCVGFDRIVFGAASPSHAASTNGSDPISPHTLDGLRRWTSAAAAAAI